jgi:ABC-type transport system substrate-binding protein
MTNHRRVSRTLGVVALSALAATAAACGSSGPSTSSSAPATTPTSTAPTSPATTSPATSPSAGGAGSAAAAAAVSKNWEAFFNAATPVPRRVALLQDGSEFASIIKSQAGSGLAAAATAKVTHVTVSSPTEATVDYEILVAGTPELKNQTGTAVFQDGSWKVGVSSFCGLLVLENAGKTSGLPTACKSA